MKVTAANGVSAFNSANVNVVAGVIPAGSIVNDVTPAGATSKKLPVTVSPSPAALLPEAKSDSSTLPSVPATLPSFKATMVGTPTTVMVSVVLAISPSPSLMA